MKKWISSKKEIYTEKAENQLNSMPIDKRKRIFKIVFGLLGFIVLLKIILFVVFSISSSTEEKDAGIPDSIETKNITEKDVLNMDLSTHEKPMEESKKRGLEKMIDDMRKTDSLENNGNK